MTKSPGVIVVDDVAEPGPPGPQDVILRPEVVGICGSGLRPGRRVVVLGAGPVGLATIMAAAAAGVRVMATDFRAAVRLVADHRELIAPLLTHRFPLTGAREAIECAVSPRADAVKVLINVSDHE